MASKVIVKMRTCGRTHNVIAKLREDGDVDIKITSDCEYAKQFAERCTIGLSSKAVNFLL